MYLIRKSEWEAAYAVAKPIAEFFSETISVTYSDVYLFAVSMDILLSLVCKNQAPLPPSSLLKKTYHFQQNTR